jgi:hypothetical protein
MGAIEVLVSEDDLEAAREVLLADDVESAFDDTGEVDEWRDGLRDSRMRVMAIAVLACLVLGVILRVVDMAG